jgi:hypothetical protein
MQKLQRLTGQLKGIGEDGKQRPEELVDKLTPIQLDSMTRLHAQLSASKDI